VKVNEQNKRRMLKSEKKDKEEKKKKAHTLYNNKFYSRKNRFVCL